MNETPATIPLFPLNLVLFPGGPLSLRIFEPRYVDMIRRCMREGSGFGVVLLEQPGPETDPAAHVALTGTLARIVDFSPLPDGLLGIVGRGERRFRILRRWRQADGLNLGEVEWLAPEPQRALPEAQRRLADMLRQIWPRLAEAYAQAAPPDWADAGWIAARIAEVAPLPRGAKQELLELDDPLQRLERIEALLRQASSRNEP